MVQRGRDRGNFRNPPTNVDRRGWTPSEKAVRPRLDEIFAQTKKKLFFSCFSSSIHRIRVAMELAHKHGRKVAIIGRSLDNSTEIAQDLGYLDLPSGLIINPGQIRDLPAFRERLRGHGIETKLDFSYTGCWRIYIVDPWGNDVCFCENGTLYT